MAPSSTKLLKKKSGARPTPSAGGKKALLIGVAHVQGRPKFPRIHFAHRDTRAMRDFLVSKSGYSSNDVIVMLDDRKHPRKWWPTKMKILEQIDSLVKNAVENDQFFVYFSGHGSQVICTHGTEDDGLDEAFLTGDGQDILDNVLKERLVDPLLKINNIKLFVLFDCCHSATMLDLPHHSSAFKRILSGVAKLLRPSQEGSKDNATFRRRGKSDSHVDPVSRAPENEHGHQVRSMTFDSTISSFGLHRHLPLVNSPKQISRQVEPEMNGSTVVRMITLDILEADNEQAYDDNETGDTVTKFFIAALTDKYDRTWLELLEEIRRRVNEVSKRRTEDLVTTINLQRPPHPTAGGSHTGNNRRATLTSTSSYGGFGPVDLHDHVDI
ncbi:caspase domain-containing protein [Melanogaster broomeanus]|nr:caspase domain-containing protein [Melanogaster broomeanus]